MPSFQAHLSPPPPAAPLSRRAQFCHRCFELFCTLVFRGYCPLSAHGRAHLPPPPFIFCSNHSSHMDSPALMYASGLGFRRFGMIAAQDYFFDHGPRKSLLPALMNLIPTQRKATRRQLARLLADCRRFVGAESAGAAARCLILYPEGTRSRNGKMQPLKKGAALLSTELGLPIVPAYIRGTFEALPAGVSLPRPRRIRVYFAAPLLPEPAQHRAPGSAYARLNERLMHSIQQLREHAGD